MYQVYWTIFRKSLIWSVLQAADLGFYLLEYVLKKKRKPPQKAQTKTNHPAHKWNPHVLHSLFLWRISQKLGVCDQNSDSGLKSCTSLLIKDIFRVGGSNRRLGIECEDWYVWLSPSWPKICISLLCKSWYFAQSHICRLKKCQLCVCVEFLLSHLLKCSVFFLVVSFF